MREGGKPAFPPGLAVAIAVASVSFAAPLFRLTDAPAATASFWRLALAVLLLLPFARSAAWRAWRGYAARDWAVAGLAGVALGAHFVLWVTSLRYTSVAASTSLVTLQAVFVALGGHLVLHERLAGRNWLGVALACLGGAGIAWADSGSGPSGVASAGGPAVLGDVLALVAGLGSAVYLLVGRRLRQRRGLVEYVVPVYLAAALAVLLALPVLGQPLTAGLGGRDAVLLLLLAAVPMLGGHTMANWAVRHLPAHTVATWILLEPIGAAFLAWPLLGEVPSGWVMAGGALVLVGAALTIPSNPRRADAVASEPAT